MNDNIVPIAMEQVEFETGHHNTAEFTALVFNNTTQKHSSKKTTQGGRPSADALNYYEQMARA